MSLFSVVIPTYNRAPFLQKTLASVLAQTCQDFELIVVDDGSTDTTPQVLESFGARVRVLQQKNRGPGAARNLGARHATGEYLAFLDSDDLWFPWTLATYAQIINEHKRPTLIAGTLKYFYEETELDGLAATPLALESFADYFSASGRGRYCGTCQMLVRRTALLDVGGFAEEKFNAEDHDLVMRLGTAPGFVFVTAPDMIAYRQHPQAVTRDVHRPRAPTGDGTNRLLSRRQGPAPGAPAHSGAARAALDFRALAPAGISKSLGPLPPDLHVELGPGQVSLPGRLFRQSRFAMSNIDV
jgi:glycosyltransferase involved in cell wall biosynthesis